MAAGWWTHLQSRGQALMLTQHGAAHSAGDLAVACRQWASSAGLVARGQAFTLKSPGHILVDNSMQAVGFDLRGLLRALWAHRHSARCKVLLIFLEAYGGVNGNCLL